ncbi:MAG: pyridoxamine 5'-phosphate oxidase family protein, partial [Clostridia bacterium]|nr:pyridoxamine 5'-phosphate oxidase family protein [Clostridia bacterium]
MRRNDREITDINEIFAILDRCDSICLGMNDGDRPYVIPMTFGCELKEGRIAVYVHCAGEGHKIDLLARDPAVCVEGHIYERVEMLNDGGITARYESVIGFGGARRVADAAEKVHAMKIMLAHYNNSGFPVTSCSGMQRVE